ncbi:divergent polysaccharide deacetylase family protein [Motiliproteus sediminis]|uniref:divergent polysaccharide deacetylase family protein n=1 Tax=Motiliproteus sediminis TaxID=1468178 RepID=UPI001AEF7463|nr:divergent polysaccharide deacetylase family protein [Motiliproteus sediminis]
MRCIAALLALGICLAAPAMAGEVADAVAQPAVVIIIDDVGDNWDKGSAAVALPGPVTYAVLPHSPFGPRLARQAYARGKDVILHAPMENTHDRALGPGALTESLSAQQFAQVLRSDLDSVPHVQGLNNHMGSLLTKLRPQMEWVMDEAQRRQLFFVDSGTTPDSIAWQVARDAGIPYLRRDIFLDHEQTPNFVHQQFQKTLRIARERGWAVAIGHPYPVTVDYLAAALPLMDEMGIRLVSASALLMEHDEERRLRRYYHLLQAREQQRLQQQSCARGDDSACEPSAE